MTSLQADLLAKDRKLWSGGAEEYHNTLDADCLITFTEMGGVSTRDEIADQPYQARVSSGYVNRNGSSRMMFHQQTPLAG